MVRVTTKDYDFHYEPPQYASDRVDVSTELYRLSLLADIKRDIVDVLRSHGVRGPKKRKWSMEDAVSSNIVGRSIFEYFNLHVGVFHDPLIPHDYVEDVNYMKTITDTFEIPGGNDQVDECLSKIALRDKFNRAIEKVRTFEPHPCAVIATQRGTMTKFTIAGHGRDRSFNLLTETYDKLRRRAAEYTRNEQKDDLDEFAKNLTACLLIRYTALDSAGHQWAMPGEIKDLLPGVDFEMFASAFNHHYTHYCSMFYDLEKYFMSLGPFQNVKYIRGIYVANPPYSLDALNLMVSVIIRSVEEARAPIGFIFGLPDWVDAPPSFGAAERLAKKTGMIRQIYAGTVKWFDHMTGKISNYTPGNRRLIVLNQQANRDILKQASAAFDQWTRISSKPTQHPKPRPAKAQPWRPRGKGRGKGRGKSRDGSRARRS